MGAGDSARELARRTAKAADALQRRADATARMSATFGKGADGEEELSATLVPLAARGWLALPDRQTPRGGNIDEVIVGPAGVIVIDAKKWSYSVNVKGDDIFAGRFKRSDALDGVIGQVEIVNAALDKLGFPARVQGLLALAGSTNQKRNYQSVREVGIVGLDHIVDEIVRMEVVLTTAQREEAFRVLSLAFPPMLTTGSREEAAQYVPVKVRKLFDKNARFFYIQHWKKSGQNRLYLKSSDGSDLAWKNVNTGDVEVTCYGDDAKLVQIVLESASPTGVTLAAENVPKIALNFPGGRLLSRITPLSAPVLVGQEWRSRGTHRLYGTLIYSGDATYSLGFADLVSGQLHPAVDGKLGKDYSPAVNYLRLLVERRPIIAG
jgi:hypothetical protein